ncbi:MAG: hypothetical protein LBV32_08810 [Tannerellaceae bacterium]|jgi:hypothetical protein|nr:hypothetical protein [Tannerellaceae bacterium]
MKRKKTGNSLKVSFNLQLGMAILLVLSGIVLLFSGFWVAPGGEVHHSVLVAFGEVMTFAGALFGVDYSYRVRRKAK